MLKHDDRHCKELKSKTYVLGLYTLSLHHKICNKNEPIIIILHMYSCIQKNAIPISSPCCVFLQMLIASILLRHYASKDRHSQFILYLVRARLVFDIVSRGRILSGVGFFVVEILDKPVVAGRSSSPEERTNPVYPVVSDESSACNGTTETSSWIERTASVVNTCRA
jgi:hypothetical protein